MHFKMHFKCVSSLSVRVISYVIRISYRQTHFIYNWGLVFSVFKKSLNLIISGIIEDKRLTAQEKLKLIRISYRQTHTLYVIEG